MKDKRKRPIQSTSSNRPTKDVKLSRGQIGSTVKKFVSEANIFQSVHCYHTQETNAGIHRLFDRSL